VLSDHPKLLPRTHRGLRRRPLLDIASPSPELPPTVDATVGHAPRPRWSRARAGQPLQSTLDEPLGGPTHLVGQGRLAIPAGEPTGWREGMDVRIGILPRAWVQGKGIYVRL
jgi:hypothetical protein